VKRSTELLADLTITVLFILVTFLLLEEIGVL